VGTFFTGKAQREKKKETVPTMAPTQLFGASIFPSFPLRRYFFNFTENQG